MNTRQHLDLTTLHDGGHLGGVTAAPFYSNPIGPLDGAGEGVNALSTSPVNAGAGSIWHSFRDFICERSLGIHLKTLAMEADISACLARRKAARPDRQAAALRRV